MDERSLPRLHPNQRGVSKLISRRRIHVVAAVIEGPNRQCFLAKRPDSAHQGGLWEFPGGKVELAESEMSALSRELDEELGIQVRAASPLIRIQHDYADKSVLLSCWRVHAFEGEPYGRERQQTCWAKLSELHSYAFPAANLPIIHAAQLPQLYAITPQQLGRQPDELASYLRALSERGVGAIQLRFPDLPSSDLSDIYHIAEQALEGHSNVQLWLNTSLDQAAEVGASYVHLSASRVVGASRDELESFVGIGASCHDRSELHRAYEIGAHYALLSPVSVTKTHPQATVLGWQQFADLIENALLPVYALGGMGPGDLLRARVHGAQGVAAIRGFGEGC